MLACAETVTLVHPARGDDSDAYVCTVIQGASWYRKAAIAPDGDGAKPVPVCKARIPAGSMPEGVIPEEGDYLVRGSVEEIHRAPADLSGHEYMLVTVVGDNRRGRLQHWFLSGGGQK